MWENKLSEQINEIIFSNAETLLTDAGDVKIAKNIVFDMLVRINVYLRGEATTGGDVSLFGTTPGLPRFTAPMLVALKKIKKKHMTLEAIPMDRGGW